MGPVDLQPGDWAVLGAVAEGPVHGFAVAQLLAPDGPLGRVWSIPRPVVYRSLKKLSGLGLISERATETSSQGPRRTVLAVTPAGCRRLRAWLGRPVEHVRDMRSELLLKLALLDRAGQDHGPLVSAQRRRLMRQMKGLEAAAAEAEGFDGVLAEWRLASTRGAVEFLEAILPR